MYFALKQKEHAAWVFRQLLSARRLVKDSPTVLLTPHSRVELLARQLVVKTLHDLFIAVLVSQIYHLV